MEEQLSSKENLIEIRKIEENELKTFNLNCTKNGFFCASYSTILGYFRIRPEAFLVAARRDTREIIGTCCNYFLGEDRMMITGLTAQKEFPFTLNKLISFILQTYPNMKFDVNVPACMRPFFEDKGWTRQWDIHFYAVNISRIHIIPLENEQEFDVDTIEYENLPELNLVTDTKQLSDLSVEEQASSKQIVFNLRQPNPGSLFATAILSIDEPFMCFIRMVLANNEEAAKHLLRRMFLYVKNKTIRGSLSTYVLSNKVNYSDFLKESGFAKFPDEWIRYTSNESNFIVGNLAYDDARIKLFSPTCFLFCAI